MRTNSELFLKLDTNSKSSPLEQLKAKLSPYGSVTHRRNGRSFRLVLRFWNQFPRENMAFVKAISEFFNSLGMVHRTACTKSNLYIEWEIRK